MQTIKSSTEISQLFSTGHRLHTPYFTVIVGVQDDKQSNYGDTAIPVVSLLLRGRSWGMPFGETAPSAACEHSAWKWVGRGPALT